MKEFNIEGLKKKIKIPIGPRIDTSKAWAFFDGAKNHAREICGVVATFHLNKNHTSLLSLGLGLITTNKIELIGI